MAETTEGLVAALYGRTKVCSKTSYGSELAAYRDAIKLAEPYEARRIAAEAALAEALARVAELETALREMLLINGLLPEKQISAIAQAQALAGTTPPQPDATDEALRERVQALADEIRRQVRPTCNAWDVTARIEAAIRGETP